MEEYKQWLEQQIERCLNDKDLQREHWVFCKAYEKFTALRQPPVSGSLQLVSRNCVNSTWTASWLQKKGLDHCQCGFECKVRVKIERNGHAPYTYIVTKKEYNKLRKELMFQQ